MNIDAQDAQAGRDAAAREAGSGDDPVRISGCSGIQASRFLKKSCASCASMLIKKRWRVGALHGSRPAYAHGYLLPRLRRYPPPQRRNGIPRERGRPARILLPAKSLPSTATPSQSAPNPPLRGSLPVVPKSCAGGTPALPGGLVRARRPRSRVVLFDRLHCLHRLIREGCQRNERCEKSLQCTSSAMEADGLFVHQQRSDASLIPGIHTNGKLCFWNESPTLTAYLGWSSPGSAGVPPASFFLQRASRPRPLPRKAHQTRLYGVLFPRARLCAGETPAFPGGLVRARRPRSRGGPFDRLHCLHRLIREGCQRNERCEKSLQCTSSAMEADGLFVHQQRSDASLIPGIHTNGKLCFWNESPTLTAYLGWSSPGSAGVPPASFFLQRASRPRPLPRKAHQTRLYGVLFPRAFVRARRPRSRGVLCGRDARVPGGSCAGGTPALPGGPF